MSDQPIQNGPLKPRHACERGHSGGVELTSEAWIPPDRGAGQAYRGPEWQDRNIGSQRRSVSFDYFLFGLD
jgi:hypothetical protein